MAREPDRGAVPATPEQNIASIRKAVDTMLFIMKAGAIATILALAIVINAFD